MDNYDLAPSGLIKLIKQGFNAGVDHAGSNIGQPTNFFVSCALNLTAKNMERQMKIMKKKIEGGADYVMTQPIYSLDPLQNFLKMYADTYGPFPIPILAGVLPLASARHAAFLHQEVPGIDIPPEIHEKMQAAGDKGAKTGIQIAVDLIEEIKTVGQGIYLMPAFNHFDYAAEIIESVNK
jgi:homocysteine S-methyltransferase